MFKQSISPALTIAIFALGLLTFSIGLVTFLPFQANASTGGISELRTGAKDFLARVKALYRLDSDALDQIWDAYCGGGVDPNIEGDKETAAALARDLQQKEDAVYEPLQQEVSSWMNMATQIQDSSSTASSDEKYEAKQTYDDLIKEQNNLQRLQDGLVLRGSNHPFIQYSIAYGIQAHKDLCGTYGDGYPNVCDKGGWPGIDGRPDLVVIRDGQLRVYEFKPDNERAKRRGDEQLAGYVPAVVKYYQKQFPDGPTGKYEIPDDIDEHGGQAFLDALANSPGTWSGNSLTAAPILYQYKMCEKKF